MVLLFITLISGYSFGQDTLNVQWEEKFSMSVDSSDMWSMDRLENYYLSKSGNITKYDSTGQKLFMQSIKSLGTTSSLDPINSMKLVHFSEEQQTLCYFDNTLTNTDDCIELLDRGVENASLVCISNQPNKIWVLDNVNSSLILLSLDGTLQNQEIKNLRGILNVEGITMMIERNNRLLLLDEGKGIYIFDVYGSLLEFIEGRGIKSIEGNEAFLFSLSDDYVKMKPWELGVEGMIKLPIEDVQAFTYLNGFFFLRTATNVYKFALRISK
ncbi:MAG: hypothetical protein MK066_00920 [Crocinitomicaceae bacterium]|nr:hypothetical protein [Crocinitomicaceae bacterium]